uniref:P-type ATPase A domain-containing protein n=1 Tax=Fagus sylvatica TaxID=28930 RepID=A0A2N9EDV8_FAGSY
MLMGLGSWVHHGGDSVIPRGNVANGLDFVFAEFHSVVIWPNGCLGWLCCFSILPATELVPGDIVEVCGESCSVEKELESTRATIAVYQDKTNILFSGTVVVAGRARAVVVGVGANTAMGSIRDSMLQTEDEVTPLKKKLDEFGTFLAKVTANCLPSLSDLHFLVPMY